jgi:hypothetical protein
MAMAQVFSFTTALLSCLLLMPSTALAKDILQRGSSISTRDDTTAILVSPDGVFSCGFYKVATNAFTFSIWFSRSANKTVTWTANRDTPVNGNGSRIVFQKSESSDLLDYDGTAIWSTNTAAIHAKRARPYGAPTQLQFMPKGQRFSTPAALSSWIKVVRISGVASTRRQTHFCHRSRWPQTLDWSPHLPRVCSLPASTPFTLTVTTRQVLHTMEKMRLVPNIGLHATNHGLIMVTGTNMVFSTAKVHLSLVSSLNLKPLILVTASCGG